MSKLPKLTRTRLGRPRIPKGYRKLKQGSFIEERDLFDASYGWRRTSLAGRIIPHGCALTYIRRIRTKPKTKKS